MLHGHRKSGREEKEKSGREQGKLLLGHILISEIIILNLKIQNYHQTKHTCFVEIGFKPVDANVRGSAAEDSTVHPTQEGKKLGRL